MRLSNSLKKLRAYAPGKPLVLWGALTCFFCLLIIGVEAQTIDRDRRYTSMLQNVFDFIQKHYVEEVDPKKLYEGAMSGMLGALGDPYSQFLAEKDMTELNQNVIRGSYGGVGLYISKPVDRPDGKPSFVEIASPIEGTPGWRAGLQPGDLIIKINDELTDTLSMDDVLARLKGPAGDQVRLLIRRGTRVEFPVTLTRAIIEVPTVKQAMIGDIGYLRLISFSNMTADRARESLSDFKRNNYKGLILDLRNNYGGLLNSAVDICNLFLEGGVVVSVKSRIPGQSSVSHGGRSPVVPQNIPIIVLINHGSASASEIVAGALKDRNRAYLVGEKSYGKGSVQQVYPLPQDKSGFKITTARYFTPSDVNIDKVGIPPDREILFPKFSTDEADALNKLINSNMIPEFVERNPQASPGVADSFARQLQEEFQLDFNLLRRLIRDEQNRTVIAPVYDLEYDVQLQEAVRILHEGSFFRLIKNTKTLRDLQQDAAAQQAAAS